MLQTYMKKLKVGEEVL